MPDVKISPASIVIALAVILILGVFGWLSFGPRPAPPPAPVLTQQAKAYLGKLALSNVRMQAAESYVNQRVVEILGDITDKGDRTVETVEVTCVFSDFSGQSILRERVFVVDRQNGPLKPSQTKPFRLAFDDIPNTWNQAIPSLVIAQIQFE